MKRIAKKGLSGVVGALPLGALQRLAPRKVVQLFYHVVSDRPLAHTRNLYPYRPFEQFEQDLAYVCEHYTPISYEQLVDPVGIQTPKTALHISFDDGFRECFTFARPLLKKYAIPCTFFLATDFIDNGAMYYRNKVSLCIERVAPGNEQETWVLLNQAFSLDLENREDFLRWVKSLTDEAAVDRVCSLLGVDYASYLKEVSPYLTREQIRVMTGEGFTMGAHSRKHHKLVRLSPQERADEIVESCRAVAAITGEASVPFSFPNSGDGVERRFLEDLRKAHPEIGLIFDTKGLRPGSSTVLNRVWVEAQRWNPQGKTSLPLILTQAYREALLS
jgi:peptidoglycan/xylan/chitin deacetylase (PgdA/CDA1 family)